MKSLVFEGCGLSGMAYIGVLRELERREILPNIRYFAGASSGAFIGTMAAMGMDSYTLEHTLKTIGIADIVNTCCLQQVYNICRRYGLHSRKKMRRKLESIFQTLGYSPRLTFQELYERTGNVITIVVTNINIKKPIYYNLYYYPKSIVLDILVASLSVPLLFELDKSTHYVDGGISDNYPIWLYSNIELLKKGEYEQLRKLPIPSDTIGVKIADEKNSNTSNLLAYISTVYNSTLTQLEHMVMPSNYNRQTITINNINSDHLEFTIDNIEALIEIGMDTCNQYFSKRK